MAGTVSSNLNCPFSFTLKCLNISKELSITVIVFHCKHQNEKHLVNYKSYSLLSQAKWLCLTMCLSLDLFANLAFFKMWDRKTLSRKFTRSYKNYFYNNIKTSAAFCILICSGMFSIIFQESRFRIQLCAFSEINYVCPQYFYWALAAFGYVCYNLFSLINKIK